MTAAGSDRIRLAVEAGAEITGALSGDDAPGIITSRVATALDVWGCDLYEYDPDIRTLTATATWSRRPSPRDDAWVGSRIALDERPGLASVIEGGRPRVVRAGAPGLDQGERDAMAEWGEVETLTMPLRFRERGIVGCLMLVEKREGRRFTEEDLESVGLLAGPAAVAVRNARLFRLQRDQNRYLASLLDTGRAITTSVTVEDSLADICRTAAEALESEECIAYEYDPDRDAIIRRASFVLSETAKPFDDDGVYALDDYPSDREILRRGEVVQEMVTDPRLPEDVRASMERWGEKTCLNVPLVFEGEALGILVLIETGRERVFGLGEVELARAMGEQAAIAIRHARLFRRGERQNLRLAALLETSRVLASSLDVDAVLAEVRREVAGLFGVPGDAVRLLLRRADGFVPFRPGPPAHGDEPAAVELDELEREAVAGLAPAMAADRSRLVVPFISGEAAEGLLDLRTDGVVVGDPEAELLQVLASQAAAALAHASLYRTLERQAITDGLTGLYNHRYFYERLNQEIARAQRYDLPLALLMIDIDDFKHFNDRFGHPAGDLVLREVGRILSTQIRVGIDIACRYGGEEFAIVLPNTCRDGAQVVGRRLARQLSSLSGAPPANEAGAVAIGENIRVTISEAHLPGTEEHTHVTVSVGIACFPGAAAGPGELVRHADRALYQAKGRGKNRVEVFGA